MIYYEKTAKGGAAVLRISQLTLPLDGDGEALRRKAARVLRVPAGELADFRLVRQSIDARKKQDIHLVCTVTCSLPDEEAVLRRAGSENVTRFEPISYAFPGVARRSALPPVVAGMGPAGLFAALFLARNGLPCIVLERGEPVEARAAAVERFWAGGPLDPESNVQFGEGGAGTFSDGKLTTGTHDPRISAVVDTLIAAGAPEDVRWSHRPHIGTDLLRRVVAALRRELIALGCDVRFRTRLDGLRVSEGRLTGVTVTGPGGREELPCDALVLAPGHSARDTFRMLYETGVPMAAKPFAVGVRIEHLQADVGLAQYGPAWERLPPADYKLSCHLPNGRSAFSFCVCPGGQVVAAASGPEQAVTNGMSLRARDGRNINGGFLVGVNPGDFGGPSPLAGAAWQEALERAAYAAGGRTGAAPAQLAGDFLTGRPSRGPGDIQPTFRPGVTWTELDGCLPPYVAETLRLALPVLDRKLRGFARADAVLTGVESRSSSPVRILRDETYQSALRGLYPCGEGAGYAGGIVSAAVDGIRVAEAVAGGTP